MKKILMILLVTMVPFTLAWSDQITKIAVVDYNKILSMYYKDASGVREYNQYQQSVTEEIRTIGNEIKSMQNELIEARKDGDEEQVLSLETKIDERKNFLSDYARVKQTQLNEMRRRLESELSVVDEIIDALQFVAETNGFSLVLRKDEASLLWFSYDVDITDKVIDHLIPR